MNTKSNRLAKRLQEVLLDGKWIANTNFQDQTTQITWEQANKKIGNVNTIALLTFHINYYLEGILNVFKGGSLDIRDKYSLDMPELHSEEDWQAMVKRFIDNSKEFISFVEKMEDATLESPFVDVKYGSYERNIEAVIEHSYYHLGQISMLKKLI